VGDRRHQAFDVRDGGVVRAGHREENFKVRIVLGSVGAEGGVELGVGAVDGFEKGDGREGGGRGVGLEEPLDAGEQGDELVGERGEQEVRHG